jgi:serine/threonine protein kinase
VDFIAMEYVDGETLERRIGRKGLALGEGLDYAVQVASALARAHGAGIVHRDIKPANLMVTREGRVKVLDFGLAKLTERVEGDEFAATIDAAPRTEEGTIAGTISYMSPEQAEGKPVDARSDIFSFGSVLYEMISGRRAFRAETKVSTLTSRCDTWAWTWPAARRPRCSGTRSTTSIGPRCRRTGGGWRFTCRSRGFVRGCT